MRHLASPAFWQSYTKLPENIRALADKNYALLKDNPRFCGDRELGGLEGKFARELCAPPLGARPAASRSCSASALA